MKPITKIIIFLVIAFIIVLIITTAVRPAIAPATLDELASPSASVSTSPSASASVKPSSSTSGSLMAGYTLAMVAQHKTETNCWTVVGNVVYDLTPFINKHPGGVAAISQICGVDGTVPFTKMHGSSEKAQAALATLKIGMLNK